MDNISNRLKYAMDLRNIKATQLSENTGISRSSISEWLSGKYTPKQDKIFILANYLNVDEAWLLGLDVPIEKKPDIIEIYDKLDLPRKHKVFKYAEEQLKQQNNLVKIKSINNAKAAANPSALESGDIEIEEIEEITKIPAGAEFKIKVEGNSMEPLISDGAEIYFKNQESIENGELAIVEVNENGNEDGIAVKKIMFDYDNEKIILRSLNTDYDDRILPCEHVRIIGKVLL